MEVKKKRMSMFHWSNVFLQRKVVGNAFLSTKRFVDKLKLQVTGDGIYNKIRIRQWHRRAIVAIEIKAGDYVLGHSVADYIDFGGKWENDSTL